MADYSSTFHDNAVRAEVTTAIVNEKANACPMAVRLAWHAAGTFDKDDTTPKKGGSDGATMRFEPESTDGANAGLGMMRDILEPVKAQFPNMSYADIWTLAGAQAVKFTGGPEVPFSYGRSDHPDGAACPTRSGFDGPWTQNPLQFDNSYYTNLLDLEWAPREWDGPLQYADPSGKLMMLPTDLALISDEKFLPFVQAYAADQDLFFKDFSVAFAKLIALGCPAHAQPNTTTPLITTQDTVENAEFRDHAMHGSIEHMRALSKNDAIDVNSTEPNSGRTAMHKAAFWGHVHVIKYLILLLGDVNCTDSGGDTPLHDAAKFGHTDVVEQLLAGGADKTILNRKGESPLAVATTYKKDACIQLLS
eukprot:scaffold43007_cov54-Attheya_sp.AAC.4